MPLPMNSTAKRLGNGAGVEAMAFNDSSQGKAIVTPTPRRTVRLESFIAFTSISGARRDHGGNGKTVISVPSVPSSERRQKLHTDRRRGGCEDAGRRQSTVPGVDSTHQDGVGILIRDREMFRGRFDPEMTRRAAARPLLLDVGERSLLWIDAEQHHAVVSAIRDVEVSSRRVDPDLRPRVRTVEILRQ